MKKCKLLVATDFSSHSNPIFATVRLLKQKYQLKISLIHVIQSFWKNWWASDLYKKEALQRLTRINEKNKLLINSKNLFVLIGNPAECIINIAEQLRPNYILLGQQKTDDQRYKTAQTLEQVVTAAKQSVWLCQSVSLKRVLCGIDGSRLSTKALKNAIEICLMFSAELNIVFVMTKIDFNPLGLDEEQIIEEERKSEQKHSKKMDTFLKKFNFGKLKIKKHYLWGVPGDVILDLAEDFNCDLIVLGANGHSLLHHVLIGSTVKKVLRYSPCSLLVVR